MPDSLTPPTSMTLLAQLGGVADPNAQKLAWDRFTTLYEPVVRMWARKYRLPPDELPGLPGTLIMKLHRSLRYWECRRWFRAVVAAAAEECVTALAASGTELPDILASLIAAVGREDWARLEPIRARFSVRIADSSGSSPVVELRGWLEPILTSWLGRYAISTDDNHRLTEAFLDRSATDAAQLEEANLPRFHNWLHMVVRNAVFDTLEDLRGGHPVGGPEVQRALEDKQARDELARGLELREVMNELPGRVLASGQVSARDWQIYQDCAMCGKPGKQVAEMHGLTVSNVYKIRQRVGACVVRQMRELGVDEFDGGVSDA